MEATGIPGTDRIALTDGQRGEAAGFGTFDERHQLVEPRQERRVAEAEIEGDPETNAHASCAIVSVSRRGRGW